MFVEELLIGSKMWKQSKWSSTDEHLYMCIYIYTSVHTHTHTHTHMEYYSAIKKDEIMPFAIA